MTVPERAVVTVPGPGGSGDYATNIALQLARPAGQPPLRVAEILRPYLIDTAAVTDVVVTGPGFLNISLRGTASVTLVEEILRRGKRYGCGQVDGHVDGPRDAEGAGAGALLHLYARHEVRAVVVMDATARILRSRGAFVRTGCESRPEPEWTDVLGVRVDAHGISEAPAFVVRPVPARTDPLPLGRDAARWALLHPAAHDRPRITDEHLVQREGNPLFRVRYAHARTRALSRNAADLGFTAEPGPTPDGAPLLGTLADHLRILTAAADDRAPDRLARHLVTVADAALAFVPTVLPIGEEKPSAAHRARLALAEAAGAVLAGGLSLLGIDAPDHL